MWCLFELLPIWQLAFLTNLSSIPRCEVARTELRGLRVPQFISHKQGTTTNFYVDTHSTL